MRKLLDPLREFDYTENRYAGLVDQLAEGGVDLDGGMGDLERAELRDGLAGTVGWGVYRGVRRVYRGVRRV